MRIFPKINIGKLTLRTIILIILCVFAGFVFLGAKHIIFQSVQYIQVFEKDFWLWCFIPTIFGYLIGAVWVASLKSWDINGCVNRINNRLEAVKLKVFVDELVREKGWEPIGRTDDPEKERKAK
jgi:hypothetical protein